MGRIKWRFSHRIPISADNRILPKMQRPPAPLHPYVHTALWCALGVLSIGLLYLLAPILTPFLLAGILAYVLSPLVDRLECWRLPRSAAVGLVLLISGMLLASLGLILAPLIFEQASTMAERLPEIATLANERVLPWLREHFGIRWRADPVTLKKLVSENWGSLQGVAGRILESVKIGGAALVGVLINIMLTPVVMFYMLKDWHLFGSRLANLIPQSLQHKGALLARDIDGVLSQFLRGQLMVMLCLATYYSLALWLSGIHYPLAIGLVTGILIFVPYVGFATGFILALLVATLQFDGLQPIVAVLVVFGVGQVIESFILTPYLVGDRIGLHPLAVIFALMAFGQLFGFVGVLLALPASAALLVALREFHTWYLASRFYRGDNS